MYPVAKMALDEESRRAAAVKKPGEEERAGLRKEPRSRERAEASKEPVESKRPNAFEKGVVKGAPAREHGAGSRVRRPDAFVVSPSLREGLTWRFESSIPG